MWTLCVGVLICCLWVGNCSDTPLHLSACGEMTLVLLKHGANPNMPNRDQQVRPQLIANMIDSTMIDGDIKQMNGDQHGSTYMQTSERGLMPLSATPRHPFPPVTHLPFASVPVQVPLHVMVCNRDDASLLALLEHGNASRHNPLQIDAQDKHGDTPLHLAVAKAQVGTPHPKDKGGKM